MNLWKLVTLFLLIASLHATGETDQKANLEKKFKAALQALRAERYDGLDKLDAGFGKALDRAGKAAQDAADLDLVVEIKKLKTAFDDGEELPSSENPELKKLIATLAEHSNKVTVKYGVSVNKLIDEYVARLAKIQDAHTNVGDVEKALEVRKLIEETELRRVKDVPSSPKAGEDAEAPLEDRVDEREWKLPVSKTQLEDFLANTVWSVNGGYFRFRGDGTMTMPWHDFKWEVTKKDQVKMYTSAWHFVMKFGDDFKTLRVTHSHNDKEEWAGSFVRRYPLLQDEKKCKSILSQGVWRRDDSLGGGDFTFTSNGKIKCATDPQTWEEWEDVEGLIRLKGKKGDDRIYVDLAIFGDQAPYQLKRLGMDVRELQFQQMN